MLPRPGWSEEMAKEVGTVFTEQGLNDFVVALQGSNPQAVLSGFVPSMFTSKASAEVVNWTIERNMLMDSKNAATLLLDHGRMDWRDAIETINLPTLVVAGTGSICPVPGLEWIASHIAGAKLVVIDKEDGGSHFMFWEAPERFNEVVKRFVESGDVEG